jgi:hypothetical protein
MWMGFFIQIYPVLLVIAHHFSYTIYMKTTVNTIKASLLTILIAIGFC